MRTEEDILFELSQLPRSLSDLYSIAFEQMLNSGHSSSQLAVAALQLLLVAVRPISWLEFSDLLSSSTFNTEPGRWITKSEILDATAGFLVDDQVRCQAVFVHISARDFLEMHQERQFQTCHIVASSICLANLKLSWTKLTKNSCTYSTLYVANHLSCTCANQRSKIQGLLREFLTQCGEDATHLNDEDYPFKDVQQFQKTWPKLFKDWRQRVQTIHDASGLTFLKPDSADLCQQSLISVNPLFAICVLGLEELLPLSSYQQTEHQLEFFYPKISWEGHQAVKPYRGRTCLELAVIFNKPLILEDFYRLGLGLRFYNQRGQERETLLHLAAKQGPTKVLQVLLSCGMKPNCLSGTKQSPISD